MPLRPPKPDRTLWWLWAMILAGGMSVGIGLLFVRLRPYWVAKYRGAGADLRGAVLPRAPLRGADLCAANLRSADLHGADLRGANLSQTDVVVVSEHSVPGKPGLRVQMVHMVTCFNG